MKCVQTVWGIHKDDNLGFRTCNQYVSHGKPQKNTTETILYLGTFIKMATAFLVEKKCKFFPQEKSYTCIPKFSFINSSGRKTKKLNKEPRNPSSLGSLRIGQIQLISTSGHIRWDNSRWRWTRKLLEHSCSTTYVSSYIWLVLRTTWLQWTLRLITCMGADSSIWPSSICWFNSFISTPLPSWICTRLRGSERTKCFGFFATGFSLASPFHSELLSRCFFGDFSWPIHIPAGQRRKQNWSPCGSIITLTLSPLFQCYWNFSSWSTSTRAEVLDFKQS